MSSTTGSPARAATVSGVAGSRVGNVAVATERPPSARASARTESTSSWTPPSGADSSPVSGSALSALAGTARSSGSGSAAAAGPGAARCAVSPAVTCSVPSSSRSISTGGSESSSATTRSAPVPAANSCTVASTASIGALIGDAVWRVCARGPPGRRSDVSALDGYRSSSYDDAVAPDGSIRPAARAVMDALLSHDLAALAAGVREEIDGRGIRFESVDGDARWHVDPVPRVIAAADWERLAAGLAQRVRALNAFVAEGLLPQRVLDSADNIEPSMAGMRPAGGVWIGIAGLDLVRDAEGEWLVLEDNVRTPSGIGYWAAARAALLRRLDVRDAPVPIDGIPGALRRVFGAGSVVVLTDGPESSAYWEHDWIARRLGIPLVVPDDLEPRGDRLLHDGAPVDAVYRRTNADAVDSDVGALLAPALRAGGIRMVNCFGTGIGDDKLAHAYVPEIVRFYLGEEPLLGQVETFDLGEPRTLERALDVFDELVVKDRGSYGGLGVVVCPHAERADVERLREQVLESPADYVAQRLVALSTHPTVVDGALRPRHVDLRPFVLMSAPDAVEVLPGGITRVALDEGALVVNSSQNGGAKDTWVLP